MSDFALANVAAVTTHGWQPIETAPRDETADILVWGRHGHCPYEDRRRLVVHFSRGWWTNTHPPMPILATHWMPLPEPPPSDLVKIEKDAA